jgi:methionyl-tRNA formyltransferase
LPYQILQIAPCINLHASLLPKYRGASPIQSAILNDDYYSGITAMKMDVGLDSGDILAWEYCLVKNKDIKQLFDELSKIAANLTIWVLNNYNHIQPLKQNEVLVSYAPKIKKEDGLVDFKDAKTIYQKYLAFKYWPSIFLENGLKLKHINLIDTTSQNNMGEILQITKNSIIIGCKAGKIELIEVQPPSKKVIKAIDYIKGQRLKIGDRL